MDLKRQKRAIIHLPIFHLLHFKMRKVRKVRKVREETWFNLSKTKYQGILKSCLEGHVFVTISTVIRNFNLHINQIASEIKNKFGKKDMKENIEKFQRAEIRNLEKTHSQSVVGARLGLGVGRRTSSVLWLQFGFSRPTLPFKNQLSLLLWVLTGNRCNK